MWIYDVDTLAFLDANDAAVALYGYTREEFLALKITEIRPTEDYALFFAWLSQPPVDMRLPGDWRHKRKNGTLINVEVSSYPLTYNGRSARLVEIRDVTEQTHTAESLRESELRLRSLLDTFPYLVWIKDTEGRFLSVNQPFVDAFNQKSIKDVIGKTDLDITNRELAEKYIADDKKVIANGTRILVEEEIIANDSRKWFETHKSPMFDQNGIVLGSAGFARDITERKNYEDALRKSEEKFRRVFYTSPDAISVNRIADGMYISINRGFTQISGYTEEEIIGRTSFEIQIWENLEDRKKLVEGLKKSGSVENLEARFRAKNGSTIIGLLSAAVIDINGEPCIIIITRDISEMKKTEQLLRDTQRRESLGVLSSGIAHDFNNLLGIMLGNISLAQSHLPPAHAAMNNIEKALTAMERAAELTKQMLAYSGKGKFQIRTIDLVAVVKEHASLFDVSLPKNVKLETRLSAEPVYINGDPGQIEQIIMNLIINGGDAIGEAQGVVSVTLETCVMNANELAPYGRIANTVLPSGAYACLEVRDNGIGMSRETMRKIFDPFFTTKFTGRGLGLSAVLGILQGHKGGLIVDSTEGKGT
ncbi:MAG TPA: PAS domain S-box protein, partial [Bacteroidota bacterium]|nr:PAS domain S-box protein [Bacteroidota bacterium]